MAIRYLLDLPPFGEINLRLDESIHLVELSETPSDLSQQRRNASKEVPNVFPELRIIEHYEVLPVTTVYRNFGSDGFQKLVVDYAISIAIVLKILNQVANAPNEVLAEGGDNPTTLQGVEPNRDDRHDDCQQQSNDDAPNEF